MRLIDVDALPNGRVEWEDIVNAPTIDTVKHGRWERHYFRPNVFADLYWHCSECGYKNGNQWANRYHKYCPTCGAKMDEVKE